MLYLMMLMVTLKDLVESLWIFSVRERFYDAGSRKQKTSP
ncbi:hypothetical protein HMPREF0880_00225 [Yokenella regensburgei ATCC 43003]|nr:hypothetical protein HMPREF0880_00225 [Yokenella regensburgei ATCC 43003]